MPFGNEGSSPSRVAMWWRKNISLVTNAFRQRGLFAQEPTDQSWRRREWVTNAFRQRGLFARAQIQKS